MKETKKIKELEERIYNIEEFLKQSSLIVQELEPCAAPMGHLYEYRAYGYSDRDYPAELRQIPSGIVQTWEREGKDTFEMAERYVKEERRLEKELSDKALNW